MSRGERCPEPFGSPISAPGGFVAGRQPAAPPVKLKSKDGDGPVRSYLLHCDCSYGEYMFDALRDPYAELNGDLRLTRDPGEARKAASSRRR